MSTPGGEVIGQAQIDVDMNTLPAQLALREFSRDVNGRLHDIRGRFVAEGAQISRSLEGTSRDTDRFNLSLRGLSTSLGPLAGVLGKAALGIGGIGAAAGSALPLIASVVTALEQIAPAAAVATTGALAIAQANAVVKLSMIGVSDAATAAFDTSEAGAKKFDKALETLGPNAKEFVLTLKEMAPELTKFQQGIQDTVFFGFSDALKNLSTSVLPVLKTNLGDTARILNDVALSTAMAAGQLALDGTLGRAMAGANQGLTNLAGVPALVVKGLGQLAEAASPAFARITDAAAGAAVSISDKLSKAFASGGLEDAINQAIDVLSGLGTIAGNIFGTLGNVLGAASTGGDGLFAVLTSITQTLETASGTKGFQDAIGALVQTMGVFADTAGPLLGQVLAVLGPVFVSLAQPVQTLVQALGDGLSPIITALGPVLEGTAQAIGAMVTAFAPLLPILGDLIASLLPPLLPVLDTITQAFTDAAPLIVQLGDAFVSALVPAITSLTPVVFPLLDVFTQLTQQLLPVLSDLIVQLLPVFTQLVGAFAAVALQTAPLVAQILPVLADLFVQLLPSIVQVVTALVQLETAVLPVVGLLTQAIAFVLPIMSQWISLIAQAAAVLVGVLAGTITNVVIPVINTLVDLFSGNFSAALSDLGSLFTGIWNQISTTVSAVGGLVQKAVDTIIGIFQYLYDTLVGHSIIPDLVNAIMSLFTGLFSFLTGVVGSIRSTVTGAWNAVASATTSAFTRVKDAASDAIGAVVRTVSGLKDRVTGALSGVGTLLYKSGRSLVSGFIDGIKSMLGSVASAAKSVVQSARDFFGSSPAKVGPLSGKGWTLYSGEAFASDFAAGIASRQSLAAGAAGSLVSSVAQPVSAGPGVSSLLTTARSAGATAAQTVTPNVNVSTAAPRVTVMIGNQVVERYVQVLIDQNNTAVARQIAQGVRS